MPPNIKELLIIAIPKRKERYAMKKTIAKTAALAMAVMLAGSAIPPIAASALSGAISATSNESEADMKDALTKVKQRVTIPAELSEFTYSSGKSYGTKSYTFEWSNPQNSGAYGVISVSVVGNIITEYSYYKNEKYSSEPRLAALSEETLLEKAGEYLKQLDPTIADKVKLEVSNFSLTSTNATIKFTRFENGIEVSENGGNIVLDKDTGALKNFSASWMDNAVFPDKKTAKSETDIRAAYKNLCKLTPYYKITTDWKTKNKTVRIVYEPDFTSEIDAFTGKPSTIWEDMNSEEGVKFYGSKFTNSYAESELAEDAALVGGDGGEVVFTAAEMKKIQQDNNLITAEKAFELLKKDKYAALTDDYTVSSYEVYSDKQDYGVMPLAKDSSANKKEEKEKFYLNVRFTVKDELKNNYSGYKNVYVTLNAETGEMLNMQKYSGPNDLPMLDVEKANKIADSVAKTYAKSIIGGYKADESNTAPLQTWERRISGGKKEELGETAREFVYNRYVNGIGVYGDSVRVTVDSRGVVTGYRFNHTEDVKFPAADILTADQAFEKLYQQKKFDCYYDGWISKDGKVKTYLLYKMDNFYLNAKTGKLCSWNGEALNERVSASEVKYSDIKGIPQEQAILTLQKYGVILTSESKFNPNAYINENEFKDLLTSALGSYITAAYDVDENELDAEPQPATRESAAVIFADFYDNGGITKLKGIFKTPYSDVKSSDPNAGAIAVAYAKGFFGKGDGTFGGSKKITRAEAAQLIYGYIQLLSERARIES